MNFVNFVRVKLLPILLFFSTLAAAQNVAIRPLYKKTVEAYQAQDFKTASECYRQFAALKGDALTIDDQYLGASIYALNGDKDLSFNLLHNMAFDRFCTYYNDISQDGDLLSLHADLRWNEILERLQDNIKTLPQRTKQRALAALLAAKKLLKTDNGSLWGEQIWNDSILILDESNTIYSLLHLPESQTDDGILFYKSLPENLLSQTNSAQALYGNQYCVVLASYLNDSSATLAHELFHLLQNKRIRLYYNPIGYLDNYDARELMRLEFQALRNAIGGLDGKAPRKKVMGYIQDAFLFRKYREQQYPQYLQECTGLENVEGLANYTGIRLSTLPNKYAEIKDELVQREAAASFTRPFPYATGPAYGFILDYLGVNWRNGLKKTYNFLEIYEKQYLKRPLSLEPKKLADAQKRNNYPKIHEEETARKLEHDKNQTYYSGQFVTAPTLTVKTVDSLYSGSYDMNATFFLEGKGVIYASIKGTDMSGNNFGNYSTTDDAIGVSGVLVLPDWKTYVFPRPISIEASKIVGEHYVIELNKGWTIRKINEKGDLELVKQ